MNKGCKKFIAALNSYCCTDNQIISISSFFHVVIYAINAYHTFNCTNDIVAANIKRAIKQYTWSGVEKRNEKNGLVNGLGEMHITLALLSLVSLVSAVPIIVDQSGNQYYIQAFRHFPYAIERSDQDSLATADSEVGHESDYGAEQGGGIESTGAHFQSTIHQYQGGQHDFSPSTYGGGYGEDSGSHGISFENEHNTVHSVPVSEHVEVTKPIPVPVYKEIGIPVPQPVKINIPHPVAVGIPQPYPVAVPVSKPVPIQIVKTIAVPVEKKVPYPVEKHIPVPVEKAVPITIEKHIPVPVLKPYPIRIPVYKTIYHHAKGH
ncbi:uncharacterized protein [Prorops nasuta]|uniref:uncharacterized protein n=1 Tax=Prorops nasuta TaxID=863751 RepID=UPI0034D01743